MGEQHSESTRTQAWATYWANHPELDSANPEHLELAEHNYLAGIPSDIEAPPVTAIPPPLPIQQTPQPQPAATQTIIVQEKKKRGCLHWVGLAVVGLIALFALIAVVAAISSSGDGEPTAESDVATGSDLTEDSTAPAKPSVPVDEIGAGGLPANPGSVYQGRPGAEDNDHEAIVGGDGTAYSGINIYVDDISVTGQTFTVTGRFFNRDEDPHDMTAFDWKLQTPQGVLVDAEFGESETTEAIISGATANFRMKFTAPEQVNPGDTFFAVHEKFFSFDQARGVWGITIPGG